MKTDLPISEQDIVHRQQFSVVE